MKNTFQFKISNRPFAKRKRHGNQSDSRISNIIQLSGYLMVLKKQLILSVRYQWELQKA